MRAIRRVLIVAGVWAVVSVMSAGAASAHIHVVTTPNHTQQLAGGQNHPGFVGNLSCAGVNEPANAGPAGWGLETAHHGPDAGTPGKADGCYQRDGVPDDQNPAID